MREPTKAEKKKFQDACAALNELGKAGFQLYLADSQMYLMTDHSHDDGGKAQQDKVADSAFIHSQPNQLLIASISGTKRVL